MKIFVTGRNGFIAKNIIIRLEKDGHCIGTSSRNDNITEKLTEFKPEIIMHLAVESMNPDKMVESNILLTHKILEYCRYNTIQKLLIFGSSSEYGCKDHPITEQDTLEPKTIYEGTKSAATLLSRSYAYTYGIPTIVIRPMSIYGPHEKNHKLMTILFSKKMEYLNNAVHDWTYIDDFVDATISIMLYKDIEIFDIVNIGLGVQRTNYEVVSIAESLIGEKLGYIEKSENIGCGSDSAMWVCNPTYLVSKYGFTPSISLEEGMRRYYEWFKVSV